MAIQELRFAVGSKLPKRRAASWKLWSPKHKTDVYLASREIGGALKLSMHESNCWHLAYNNTFYNERIPEQNRTENGRFIDKWERPQPQYPGVTLALRIVTPWTAVSDGPPSSRVANLIEPPQEGRANEILVFMLDPGTVSTSWPGARAMGTKNIGRYKLHDESTVWAVHWDIECPDFSTVPTVPANLFEGVSEEDIGRELRALLFGDSRDGSKVIYDLRGTNSAKAPNE